MSYLRIIKPEDNILMAFKVMYPNKGKQWCIDNLGLTNAQIRYYATVFNLKSNVKFTKESNFKRGNGFRGKKRPEHSEWLKKNHPLQGKHHSKITKEKIAESNRIAHKEGRLRADNFRGFHHTESAKQKIKLSSTGRKKTKKTIQKILATKLEKYGSYAPHFKGNNNYSFDKRGYYDIDGQKIYFRSKWEANYALYLNFLIKQKQIKKWEYEKDTFWFENIKRGIRSYTPDFKVFNNDLSFEYHEVKGWMDPKSKTKIKRMAKYYPKTKLLVIDSKSYCAIVKDMNNIVSFY